MMKQFSLRSFGRSTTVRILLVLTLGAFATAGLLYQSLCEADRGFALAYAATALLPLIFSTHLAVHSSFQNQLLVKLNKQMENMQFDLEASNDKLRRQAERDALTGLANRRYFFQTAENIIAAPGSKTMLALDVDLFKKINDTYGHETGDRALCLIGNTISHIAGSGHLTARIGGEEFAILLSNVTPEEGHRIAEKIRTEIEQLQFPAVPGSFHPLSISIGLCDHRPSMDVQQLLHGADMALLEAKRQGRNRCLVLVPDDVRTLRRAAG